MNAYWQPLASGMLLGLSTMLLLLANGRIVGISGIVGGLLRGRRFIANAAFVIGLLLAPLLYVVVFGAAPSVRITAAWPLVAAAGLLVGFGTRMGSGCTSGHGIMGLARLSRRSVLATAVFMTAGILTATAMGPWR